MKRAVIFAHHDEGNEVKRYVVFLLRKLADVSQSLVFVSNSPLPLSEIRKVERLSTETVLCERGGFDFGMWQAGLRHTDLLEWDEVVLVNSSLIGPLVPLEPIFAKMSEKMCDFWSMTDSCANAWHLQSDFLVFKRDVVRSPAFDRFWKGILPYRTEDQVQRAYEIGLTTFLSEQGFRGEAFVPVGSWSSRKLRPAAKVRLGDPTERFAAQLLAAGMPFVKAEVLSDNPGKVRVARVRKAIRDSGFDGSLLEQNVTTRSSKVVPKLSAKGLLGLITSRARRA